MFNFIQEICTKMVDLTVRGSGRKNSIAKNIADEDKIKSEQDVLLLRWTILTQINLKRSFVCDSVADFRVVIRPWSTCEFGLTSQLSRFEDEYPNRRQDYRRTDGKLVNASCARHWPYVQKKDKFRSAKNRILSWSREPPKLIKTFIL